MLNAAPEPAADTPGRRRILLVVSEATDVGSQAKLGEVLRKAQLANVTIYSVGLSSTRALLQQEPKNNHIRHRPARHLSAAADSRQTACSEEEDPRLNNTVGFDGPRRLGPSATSPIKSAPTRSKSPLSPTGGAHFATFKDRHHRKSFRRNRRRTPHPIHARLFARRHHRRRLPRNKSHPRRSQIPQPQTPLPPRLLRLRLRRMTSALHVVANLQIGAVAYTSVCVRVSPAGTNRKPKKRCRLAALSNRHLFLPHLRPPQRQRRATDLAQRNESSAP